MLARRLLPAAGRPRELGWGASRPGTALVIVSSFHRDEPALPYADRFGPEIWLDGRLLEPARLHPGRPLPGTLNHVALRLAVSRSAGGLAT